MPITSESNMVGQMERILTGLERNRDLLNRLRQQGMSYARERLTWDAKAQNVARVLNWAVRRGPKPDLPPPKMLQVSHASSTRGDSRLPVIQVDETSRNV